MTRTAACTIVIPCYNGEAYLEAAVQSVLAQSYTDFHLVVVDDASTDGTLSLARRLAENKPNITVIGLPENKGRCYARNRGAEACLGPYVAFLDQDDTYHPDFLRVTTDALAQAPDLDAVKVLPNLQIEIDEIRYEAVANSLATTMLIRRAAFEFVGGWPESMVFRQHPGGGEDIAFQKLFSVCFNMRLLESRLYNYTLRPGNALDRFLSRSRTVDGKLLFMDGPEEVQEVHAETRRLRGLLRERIRQALVEPRAPRGAERTPARVRPSADRPTIQQPTSTGTPADRAEVLVDRGASLAHEGNIDEAIAHFQGAIRLKPGCARAHHNLGVAFAEQKKPEQALASVRHALTLDPKYAEAHYNLGNILGELGRHEEAAGSYRRTLALQPEHPGAMNNLGLTLLHQGALGEAEVRLRQAVRLRADFGDAWNNLGLVLTETGDFGDAAHAFEQALRLNPRNAEAHTNLGNLYQAEGRLDQATACYELALAYQPQSAATHWNRSLAWLRMGNFEQGWREYEWRWRRPRSGMRPLNGPLWDGSPLEGRTILLHMEQGLGDMIQFVRYAALVKQRGGRVVLACAPPLVRLLAGCPGVDVLVPETDPLPNFDVHVPLMSLPGILGTTLSTVPADVPYLFPNAERVEHWRARLRAKGKRTFSVGIAWQGNPRHKWDRHRSVPLAQFEPLARVKGVRLISLQKGPGTEQIDLTAARFPVVDLGTELDTDAGPFVDTAAVIAQLDLVVCTDTSIAHLAGALGARVWLALATVSDWRWLLDRDDSPWYPTMRLFRQARPGAWRRVFRRLARELRRLLAGGVPARRATGEAPRPRAGVRKSE